jgi:spore maturation protein CgeB
MRVLVSGNVYPDSFARNIATTAELMGHTVLVVEQSPVHRYRNQLWSLLWSEFPRIFPQLQEWRDRALIRAARNFQPHLILITHSGLGANVFRDIRSVSTAKIAAWYPDSLANLGRQYLLVSDLDAWFFKDPYMVRTFRAKLGLNAHYLPEACNPLWHQRVELSDAERRRYGCDLATASNMYYYRARILEPFKDYNLKVWGCSYPRWLRSPLHGRYPGVYVAEQAKAKAFNAAKIIVNNIHYAEIEGVNQRLFEAAGCGAFQIADYKPALPDLFVPEREIVTFHTQQELKEKVDHYLAHPEERQAIANRAHLRAHREHTYEIRLKTILRTLGLGAEDDVPVHHTAEAVVR